MHKYQEVRNLAERVVPCGFQWLSMTKVASPKRSDTIDIVGVTGSIPVASTIFPNKCNLL